MSRKKIERKLTKNLGGRPSKYNDDIVAKLESIFKVGGTVEEATSYAGIDKATYYRWLESKPDFATKMTAAHYYSDVVAKNLVVDDMIRNKNVDSAKWWLDKRVYKTQNSPTATFNFQQIITKNEKYRDD